MKPSNTNANIAKCGIKLRDQKKNSAFVPKQTMNGNSNQKEPDNKRQCFRFHILSNIDSTRVPSIFFQIFSPLVLSPGAGAGDVGVVVMDSNGRRDTVEIALENKGDSVFRCTYIPVLEGAHTVYVTFAGQQIPKSPFTVHISEGSFCSFQVFVISNL